MMVMGKSLTHDVCAILKFISENFKLFRCSLLPVDSFESLAEYLQNVFSWTWTARLLRSKGKSIKGE